MTEKNPVYDISRTYYGKMQAVKLSQTIEEGILETPDVTSVYVNEKNKSGKVKACYGTTVPSNGEVGYAKGCEFLKTDAANGVHAIYENIGDDSGCEFDAQGTIGATEIDVPVGKVIIGQNNGKGGAKNLSGAITVDKDGVTVLDPYADHIEIQNSSGSTLTKGTLIFPDVEDFTTLNGQRVGALMPVPPAFVITENIPNLGSGKAYSRCILGGIDTSGAAGLGSIVYASDVPGEFVFDEAPAGNKMTEYIVGKVTKVDPTDGYIYFFPGQAVTNNPPVMPSKVILQVYNNTGGQLAKGKLVCIQGTTPGGLPYAVLADNQIGKPATHFVPAAINNGQVGFVYAIGLLEGLDTSGFALNDELYLDVSGALTKNEPTTDRLVQKVGVVKSVSNVTGKVFFYPCFQSVIKTPINMLQEDANTRQIRSNVSLPALTGADQNNVLRPIMKAPLDGKAITARIISSLATSGSSANDQYIFELYNVTKSQSLNTAPVGTNANELAASTYKELVPDQNLTFDKGDVIALKTTIKDSIVAGPTDLSLATIEVEFEWKAV